MAAWGNARWQSPPTPCLNSSAQKPAKAYLKEIMRNEAWARLGVKQYYFEHFEAEKERHVNESTTAAKQTVEVL